MKMAGRECTQPPIQSLLPSLTPSEVTSSEADYTTPLSYEVKI